MRQAATGVSRSGAAFFGVLCSIAQFGNFDLTEGQFLFHFFFHNKDSLDLKNNSSVKT